MNTQAERLKKIIEEKRPSANNISKTKILAITSGKGGVGKSTITANIANILVSRGYKVGVFDASIGLANLDIIFKVTAKKNLLNVLKGECTFEEIVVEIEKNLFLIPGDSGDEIFNYETKDIYSRLITASTFLDSLDYLLIDTASGINTNVQTFLQHADEVIVTTIPDPSAITDAYALIKVTSAINENLNLIVNMAESEKEGRFIYERIRKVAENNLETPLFLNYLGFIKNSREISRSLKYRQLFSKTSPNTLVSYQLEEIVDNIILQLEHQAPLTKRKNSFSLFIKRLIENF
ncbi:MAG: MinD/ParA family protein [Epsilonproteobacteria bacterium]|nr:MinD/ParA family protein [Campylobacterota bacterium]